MVTKEQAIIAGYRTEFHYGDTNGFCRKIIGKRGEIKDIIEIWRSNGKCQTWKTRPNEFSLPIKYGSKGPHSYITHLNNQSYHLASECKVINT